MALPVLIERKYADTIIEQRVKDGYFNATAMCQAAGKQFHDYRRRKTTTALFPTTVGMHQRLTASQEFRAKHQGIFEYFQHCVRQRIEQGKLLRHKTKKRKSNKYRCSITMGLPL